MRPELRHVLTPRMIQSMEILQLPLLALEERIEQELQANPVLEMREPDGSDAEPETESESAVSPDDEGEQALVVGDDGKDDFDRLARISEYFENEEFQTNGRFNRPAANDGERDKKTDALNNTAARGISLQEHLQNQWSFVEAPPAVKQAGLAIINYINPDGLLPVDLPTLRLEAKTPLDPEVYEQALKLVQTLEPAGVGARSVRECLLLQLDALQKEGREDDEHDFDLERTLVADHLRDLQMNRYPQISKKLRKPIDEIQRAVRKLRRLHPHPGRLIGGDQVQPITPDAIVSYDPATDKYDVKMTHEPANDLYISGRWRRELKNRTCDKKTREFLNNNVRNARWLLESIQQRNNTILRVIRAVVEAQRDFFAKGPEHLKPLPMILVADQLGIHVATVSRAVSEKWIQTPAGVFPLRRFFSQGTTSAEGQDMSWTAVQEKLKIIVDNEDKQNPLSDDEIVANFRAQGIVLARRTVAKYRKILSIPTARQRQQF